jgi:hypothetical protein
MLTLKKSTDIPAIKEGSLPDIGPDLSADL